MLVLSVLTTSGAFVYERAFTSSAIETTGKVITFNKKKLSSAQEDPYVMEIRATIDGRETTFYSSRNVIEQILGAYKTGDDVPVVYNPTRYPYHKIGYLHHLYRLTLTFTVLWAVLFTALAIVWRRSAHRKPIESMPEKRV
ncbi:MAG: hypothetical protein Kow0020_07710 [Wenzhouxiangellaceae bacterium]